MSIKKKYAEGGFRRWEFVVAYNGIALLGAWDSVFKRYNRALKRDWAIGGLR